MIDVVLDLVDGVDQRSRLTLSIDRPARRAATCLERWRPAPGT
jgi:hypothetical protein